MIVPLLKIKLSVRILCCCWLPLQGESIALQLTKHIISNACLKSFYVLLNVAYYKKVILCN